MNGQMDHDDRHGREARFEGLYDASYGPVRAYALRRADRETAEEVVAETFLIAWRRLDDVPDPSLPWLYGVARRTLANARRAERRADVLADRIAAMSPPPLDDDVGERLGERELIRGALARLGERDRETLMLVAWEQLEPADAARAAGCTQATFAVRLHRARRRLAAALDAERQTATADPNLEGVR